MGLDFPHLRVFYSLRWVTSLPDEEPAVHRVHPTRDGGPAMWQCGVLPERTRDPAEASTLLEMDGAAILICDGVDADAATAAMADVLGGRVRAYREPVRVATNPVAGQALFFDRQTRTVNAEGTRVLPPHVDGYMVYGEAYPDVVFLLCARQAGTGGESFAVDGLRLLIALTRDPGHRDLLRFLWRVPIEQSTHTGVRVTGPIVRCTPGGRISIRRHEQQRLPDDAPAVTAHQQLLDRWRAITGAAAAEAPRFRLRPGELLCLDNYRVFHAREAYTGQDRLLHRIWAWTDAAFGLPDLQIADDGQIRDITMVTR